MNFRLYNKCFFLSINWFEFSKCLFFVPLMKLLFVYVVSSAVLEFLHTVNMGSSFNIVNTLLPSNYVHILVMVLFVFRNVQCMVSFFFSAFITCVKCCICLKLCTMYTFEIKCVLFCSVMASCYTSLCYVVFLGILISLYSKYWMNIGVNSIYMYVIVCHYIHATLVIWKKILFVKMRSLLFQGNLNNT